MGFNLLILYFLLTGKVMLLRKILSTVEHWLLHASLFEQYGSQTKFLAKKKRKEKYLVQQQKKRNRLYKSMRIALLFQIWFYGMA